MNSKDLLFENTLKRKNNDGDVKVIRNLETDNIVIIAGISILENIRVISLYCEQKTTTLMLYLDKADIINGDGLAEEAFRTSLIVFI